MPKPCHVVNGNSSLYVDETFPGACCPCVHSPPPFPPFPPSESPRPPGEEGGVGAIGIIVSSISTHAPCVPPMDVGV